MSAQISGTAAPASQDVDVEETREWLDALSAVIGEAGADRAHYLLEQLLEHARQNSIDQPFSANTGYVNTIEPSAEAQSPGNLELEGRLRAYMRWNAMALVVKANRLDPADGGDLGGHISSFASLAHMFAAGFNHFWKAESASSHSRVSCTSTSCDAGAAVPLICADIACLLYAGCCAINAKCLTTEFNFK